MKTASLTTTRSARHLAASATLLACAACAPLPRGTVRPTVLRADLPFAVERCEVDDIIEDTPGQYYVLACDKIAIYSCEAAEDDERSGCTRIAEGTRKEVLPEDRSLEAIKNKATRLFESGREMAKDNRLLEACDLFGESDGLFRTYGSAMNFGDCEASDGHLKHAWHLYQAAVRLAQIAGEDRPAKFAQRRESAMGAKLCTLVITIPDPTLPGLLIHVGAQLLDPAPTIRMVVDPHATTVAVDSADRPPFRRTVSCVAGASITINVPGAPTTVPQAPRTASQPPRPTRTTVQASPKATAPVRPDPAGQLGSMPDHVQADPPATDDFSRR